MVAYFVSKEEIMGRNNIETELAVQIFTPKYKKRHKISKLRIRTKESFEILGIKQLHNTQDEKMLKIWTNGLQVTLIKNLFRYKISYTDFFEKKKNEIYDFEITDVFTYQDKLIYKIDFNRKTPYEGAFNTKVKTYGSIYIRQNDYAIIEMKYTSKIIGEDEDIFQISHVKYEEYQDKLFLSYIASDYHNEIKNYSLSYLSKTSRNSKLFINRIETENIKTIKNNNTKGHLHLNKNIKYDPEFWKNYNYILDTIPEQRDSLLFKD